MSPDPPTRSPHSFHALQIPTLRSRFATAPEVWNVLFAALKAAVPKPILADKALMKALALLSLLIICVIDKLVGATNAMRIDACAAEGSRVRFSVTHDDMEQSVGLATTAAFALEALHGGDQGPVPPGFYFPAGLPEVSSKGILQRVRSGRFGGSCSNFNKTQTLKVYTCTTSPTVLPLEFGGANPKALNPKPKLSLSRSRKRPPWRNRRGFSAIAVLSLPPSDT